MTHMSGPRDVVETQLRLGPVLIRAERIADRVKTLGAAIDRDGGGRPIQMVVVMNGAWIFASDLVRSLESDVTVSFVGAASYGNSTVSGEVIRVAGESSLEIKGENTVLVDDIVDTGLTAQRLISLLTDAGAARVRVATLLSKTARRKVDVPIEFLGFEIPDKFVVGYGMDYGGLYRQLPDIHVLR